MRRRSSRSIAGTPLLIGAVTVLVVIVAVFLSYNANNGLPFVPTYDLHVQLADANSLQVGNEVRIGGTRVGVVSSESPHQNPHTGAVNAVITVKLSKSIEPLPVDTTAIVRDRSALGEKYLQLVPGTSTRTLADGATLPLANATPQPVEIDQVLNMFNPPTRAAEQTQLEEYGNAFAGRGGNINNAISNLAPAVTDLEPVLQNLAQPTTGLADLFRALERAAAQVAPVADDQAQTFVDLDTTFTALAAVAPSIGQATADGPASLDQAIHSLAFERPFIRQSTNFFALLRPSAASLHHAATTLGPALKAGATNLPAGTRLNRQLKTTFATLEAFSLDPAVPQGIQDLTSLELSAEPIVSDLAGMQVECNYPTLLVRNLASAFSGADSNGTFLYTLGIAGNTLFNPGSPGAAGNPANAVVAPNNEIAAASAPADLTTTLGTPIPPFSVDEPTTAASLLAAEQSTHVHNNPYPYVGAPGQPAGVCEAANETYLTGQTVIGNLPLSKIANGRDFSRSG